MSIGNEIARFLGLERPRQRRRPFKTLHDLDRRQPIPEFEKKMATGMLREGKEVFVTAFCRGDEVVKVQAAIGNKHSCRPAANAGRWPMLCWQLGVEELRIYHNHPPRLGRSFFSNPDRRTHAAVTALLKPKGINVRSFLVYPHRLWGYSIIEITPLRSLLAFFFR